MPQQTVTLNWTPFFKPPEEYGYYLCSERGRVYEAYYASEGHNFGPWYWSEDAANELRTTGPSPKFWAPVFEMCFDHPE